MRIRSGIELLSFCFFFLFFTFRLPSAVMRNRLHEPQKCSVIEVMKPTCPTWPSTLYAFDVSFGAFVNGTKLLNFPRIRSNICLFENDQNSELFFLIIYFMDHRLTYQRHTHRYVIIFSVSHRLPVNGMYSINRMSTFLSRVNSTKSQISLSLKPFITTQLIFGL